MQRYATYQVSHQQSWCDGSWVPVQAVWACRQPLPCTEYTCQPAECGHSSFASCSHSTRCHAPDTVYTHRAPCGHACRFGFIIRRPKSTVIHIMTNGGQDEPYVPILFSVPLIFLAICFLRDVLGLRVMSDMASRTFLKLGIAVGCRTMILLQSAFYPDKESLYYKRYSKVVSGRGNRN